MGYSQRWTAKLGADLAPVYVVHPTKTRTKRGTILRLGLIERDPYSQQTLLKAPPKLN